MLTLFTLPNPTSTISSISEWSSPWFGEWTPIILAMAGLILAGILINFLMDVVIKTASWFLLKDKDKE